MQAHRTRPQVSVELSKTCKGRPRSTPVWIMRFRLPSGKDSRKVLGRAWTRKGRPADGYLCESDALLKAQAFAAEHATDTTSNRRTFAAALNAFMRHCSDEKGLRGSTMHEYRKIGQRLAARPWRSGATWADRVLDTFTADDLLAVRRELTGAKRSADTLNHYRRVVRGVFGTHPASPALAWAWKTPRVESEGKLQFYSPAQVSRLIAQGHTDLDRAIYRVATEAGPRLSEIRAMKIANVDFDAGVLRFEDGYTNAGGHAGNKGRRVRSVPMTEHVRAALAPFCAGRPAEALVFEHERKPGQPICGTSLYRRFISASRRAGLPPIRLHDLRHTFGTQAIRVFKIHEVQRMMGHRHITTTEHYLHYAPDPDAAARLSALWGADEGPPGDTDAANVIALRRHAA
ncbi:MAG TPA: tyrosine-type recombinase/integrase [Solirubrobacteraceae bacterium]|nr:tyrosine-type recombinase/integrase [Solirubrobacteraceae bacterium]